MASNEDGTADRDGAADSRSVTARDLAVAVAIALAIVAATAAFPMIVDARAAYEIPVDQRTAPGDLADPTGSSWESVESVSIPMSSAGAAVPQSSETAIESARVEAARTDEQLYVRLSWSDTTDNRSTDSLLEFADAAAVQLPVTPDEQPPIAMGSRDNQVNVWYWNGAGQSESLLAGGAGSTTQMQESTMETSATHANGRWNVVFTRPLASDRENVTDIATDEDMNVAFAVWEGSNMERSGKKAASEWYYLALDTDRGGAPYETILWAIAGIAIVFTTLVTVEGIRRTRGE